MGIIRKKFNGLNSVLIFIILFSGILILLPIFQTPITTDDIWMSVLPSYNAYHKINILQYNLETFKQFIAIGRLNPIGNFIQSITTYFMSHRLIYKFYLLILNIIVIVFIRKLISNYFPKKYNGILTFLFLFFYLSLNQFRGYYDPRLQLSGTMQISLFLFLIAMISAQNILFDKYSNKRLIIFVLSTLFCFYTYDLFFFIYAPILCYFLIKLKSKLDKRKIPSFLFVFFAVQYIIMLAVRISSKNILPDATTSFKFREIVRTFKIQLLSIFPTTKFQNKEIILSSYLKSDLFLIIFILIFSVYILMIILIIKKMNFPYSESKSRKSLFPLVFSSSLIFTPPIVTAISARFQSELQPGLPYIGVFFEQIGITSLAAYSYTLIKNSFDKKLYVAVLITFSLWFYSISFLSNLSITNPINQKDLTQTYNQQILGWDREITETILKSNNLDILPANSLINFQPQYSWTSKEYIDIVAKKTFLIANPPKWWTNSNQVIDQKCPLDSCTFYIASTYSDSYTSGFMIFRNVATVNNKSFLFVVYRDGNSLIKNYKLSCILKRNGFFANNYKDLNFLAEHFSSLYDRKIITLNINSNPKKLDQSMQNCLN